MMRAIIGLISGVVATGPMTAAMIALHRRLPAHERYPLPPGEIVAEVGHRSGVRRALARETETATTLLSHFGYGGAAGALYAAVESRVPAHPALKGAAFGFVVWTASYLGVLPAAGILEPATEHPPRRNALMVAVHGVWGATLGLFTTLLTNEADRLEPRRGPDTRIV